MSKGYGFIYSPRRKPIILLEKNNYPILQNEYRIYEHLEHIFPLVKNIKYYNVYYVKILDDVKFNREKFTISNHIQVIHKLDLRAYIEAKMFNWGYDNLCLMLNVYKLRKQTIIDNKKLWFRIKNSKGDKIWVKVKETQKVTNKILKKELHKL